MPAGIDTQVYLRSKQIYIHEGYFGHENICFYFLCLRSFSPYNFFVPLMPVVVVVMLFYS